MKFIPKLTDSIAAIALVCVVAISANAQVGPSPERYVKKSAGQFYIDPNGGVHWFSSWECGMLEDCVILEVQDEWGTVIGYASGCQVIA